MDETTTSSSPGPPAPARQPINFRSTASTNWRVKDESPRADQPQPQPRIRQNNSRGTQNGSPSAAPGGEDAASAGTRLYVGNLLYTAQQPDIEALFTERGFNVAGVSISIDPFSGRNPSYCFVDLDTPDEAQRAIAELNGADVLGRALKVSPGVAKRGSSAQQGQGQDRQGSQSGMGGGASSGGGREVRMKNYERGYARDVREERSTEYKPTFDRWSRTDASSHWQAPQNEGRRLYVGGLPRIEPQSALDEEIQTLFATYLGGGGDSSAEDDNNKIVPTAVSKLIPPHPSKASEPGNHCYCFVDLARAEDVDVVIDRLSGKEGSWGGSVRVSRARGAQDRKVTREQGVGSGGRDGRADGERERERERPTERRTAGAGLGPWRRRTEEPAQQE